MVFPATGRHRAPDPVVYFAGGPGDSAVGEIPGQLDAVIGLIQDRDLVFIDQRGTGGSNGLTCPSPPNTLAYKSLVQGTIEACLASLRSKADLRFYTSAMAAGDVAQVLTALGYGQVNLFGVSYGATAAQVFQRLFPGRVRTMTLLSGTLLSIPYYERVPQASQQALNSVFARCASDPACHGAFPHLAAEWAPAAAVSTLGMLILAAIWAITEYHNAGGWPTQGFSQSSGIHDVWNIWIIYPAIAWAFPTAAFGLGVYLRRPISESQIKREIERQAH